MASSTSKAVFVLQLLLASMVIAWLSYDFFYTFTQGITYKIRLGDTLDFHQYPVVFVILVLIKLGVFGFMLRLVCSTLSALNITK